LLIIPMIPQTAHAERVTCESIDRRRQRCPMDTRGGVELIRNLSGVSCQNRWSRGQGYVQVWDGCRAEFESFRSSQGGNNNRITCSSIRGQNQRCSFNAGRQLSNSSSCEGNWFYDQRGFIVVKNGCRGEFERRRHN
jgi:hypothetical protein